MLAGGVVGAGVGLGDGAPPELEPPELVPVVVVASVSWTKYGNNINEVLKSIVNNTDKLRIFLITIRVCGG